MASEATLLVVQFLEWVAARPRTMRDVRAAWGSTCPLTCAWEDALSDDLVRRGPHGDLALTGRGLARLAVARMPPAIAIATGEAS